MTIDRGLSCSQSTPMSNSNLAALYQMFRYYLSTLACVSACRLLSQCFSSIRHQYKKLFAIATTQKRMSGYVVLRTKQSKQNDLLLFHSYHLCGGHCHHIHFFLFFSQHFFYWMRLTMCIIHRLYWSVGLWSLYCLRGLYVTHHNDGDRVSIIYDIIGLNFGATLPI